MKTIEKPRFSYGFSVISKVWRVSKSMKNAKKSSPECFGTPKNRAGWAGLARWAAQVAIAGPMGAQWGAPIALGLQKGHSGSQSASRAGAMKRRLLVLLVGSEDWLWDLHALRPEASADSTKICNSTTSGKWNPTRFMSVPRYRYAFACPFKEN